jgi:4-hydroxybenzoyl-CoA thioesterase
VVRSNIIQLHVEFGDCDPAGIVFYPNYFRWMDVGTRRFFAACGVPGWNAQPVPGGIIGTPLVDASARFLQSATYGETIDVESSIIEWRNKSFVVSHSIRRMGAVLVEGREVRVFATRHPDDPNRIRAVLIPSEIRALCN